ncbi:pilus assembly protein [Novosphingobium taihuense]|uniref:Flp pilus assembly protein TadG n=1 Tax=Novosphingobium taihuense TaxID=260085 RepID=A0A7W7EVJ1_9SPHN|nr:TadE/TadG family type IV pilus assembly protein [Novosphingobium taihuense]MBB4613295.1 Flp pilus assembly protein TadG [Novosphingobium taihuense]TWH85436.1 Flp pilus assembly protein TadG [Novosphingobium taihuense]
MLALRRFLTALARSRTGNILPLSAMAIFAVAALIGGAIDISRAWRTQTRLQAACDAGVLAGRRAVTTNGFDATAKAQADNYFFANFDEAHQDSHDTTFVPSSADKGGTIDAVATTSLPPLMMQLFGFPGFELSVSCTASMGVGNSDIMMVLDTTGSMSSLLAGSSQTRIEALRVAMKNFYSTVENALSGTNARVRYGFVPYSSSVNVGALLRNLDPNYLVDSWTIQSRKAIYRSVQTLTGYGTPTAGSSSTTTTSPTYSLWANFGSSTYLTTTSCNAAKPADTAWANSGSATTTSTTTTNSSGQQVVTTVVTQPQTATFYQCSWQILYFRVQSRTGSRNSVTTTTTTADPIYTTSQVFDRWEYRPVTYDTSRFKNFESVSTPTGENGASVSSTWKGCIEERSTVSEPSFTWSSLGGFNPAGAQDLEIDAAPDSSTSSKWAPMWPNVAYIRTVTYSGVVYMNSAMPSPTGLQAGSYCPTAARLLATMNSSAFNAFADSLVPEGGTYHDIGMVWGARLASPDGMWSSVVRDPPANGGEVSRHIIFMTDGEMAPSYSIQSAWGIEYHDRRITEDGHSEDTARHNSRFLALCEAVKAKGIRVWVIAFAQAMTPELQTCSSTDSAFTAANASQLDAAFQAIAKQVGELRVVQ